MTTLTDFQARLLAEAARRRNHLVMVPADIPVAAVNRRVRKLLTEGLIEEVPAKRGQLAWREPEGKRLVLRLTRAGVAAAVRSEDTSPEAAPDDAAPSSKQDLVVQLMRRGTGVTIGQVMELTGWQAHSVRGFLSGTAKKKLGLPVISEKGADGERRYHIGVLASGARPR